MLDYRQISDFCEKYVFYLYKEGKITHLVLEEYFFKSRVYTKACGIVSSVWDSATLAINRTYSEASENVSDLLIGKRLLQGESKSLDSLPEQSEKMNLKSVLEHCLEYGVNGTEGISIEVQNRIKEFLV